MSSQTAGKTQVALGLLTVGHFQVVSKNTLLCSVLTPDLSVGLTMCSFSHSWSHCVATHMVLNQFKAKQCYLDLL